MGCPGSYYTLTIVGRQIIAVRGCSLAAVTDSLVVTVAISSYGVAVDPDQPVAQDLTILSLNYTITS